MESDGTAWGRSGTVAALDNRAPGTIPDRPESVHGLAPVSLEPVELYHELDHPFKNRGKKKPGCGFLTPGLPSGECRRAKTAMLHHGTTQSLNIFLSSRSEHTYQTIKKAWQEMLTEKLEASCLPKGLARVMAEGEMCFGKLNAGKAPDQGNHRFLLEKALGDALEEGGWLDDDDWPHYEFGNLGYRYEPGRWWTRVMIFPAV
jgi:hypothetical protein